MQDAQIISRRKKLRFGAFFIFTLTLSVKPLYGIDPITIGGAIASTVLGAVDSAEKKRQLNTIEGLIKAQIDLSHQQSTEIAVLQANLQELRSKTDAAYQESQKNATILMRDNQDIVTRVDNVIERLERIEAKIDNLPKRISSQTQYHRLLKASRQVTQILATDPAKRSNINIDKIEDELRDLATELADGGSDSAHALLLSLNTLFCLYDATNKPQNEYLTFVKGFDRYFREWCEERNTNSFPALIAKFTASKRQITQKLAAEATGIEAHLVLAENNFVTSKRADSGGDIPRWDVDRTCFWTFPMTSARDLVPAVGRGLNIPRFTGFDRRRAEEVVSRIQRTYLDSIPSTPFQPNPRSIRFSRFVCEAVSFIRFDENQPCEVAYKTGNWFAVFRAEVPPMWQHLPGQSIPFNPGQPVPTPAWRELELSVARVFDVTEELGAKLDPDERAMKNQFMASSLHRRAKEIEERRIGELVPIQDSIKFYANLFDGIKKLHQFLDGGKPL